MELVLNKFKSKSRVPLNDFSCKIGQCNTIATGSKGLLSHFRTAHFRDTYFKSVCLYSKDCFHRQYFHSYASLDTHLRRFHPEFFTGSFEDITGERLRGEHFNVEDEPLVVDDDIVNHAMPIQDQEIDVAQEDPMKSAGVVDARMGNFVSKLLADEKLTQVSLKGVMKEVNDLIQKVVTDALDDVSVRLANDGCEHTEILNSIKSEFSTRDFFTGLHNQNNQKKYFKESLGLLLPIKVNLELNPIADFGRNFTGKDQKLKNQQFTYVPLLDQLQRLLNFPDIYEKLMELKSSRPGVLTSYEDGLQFRSSKCFKLHPNGLQLHLYLDEVQLCNPIGSYDQKLVFVDFSLGKLDLKFRSTFKSINLLSVFENDLVKAVGINRPLSRIVDDVKKLESGVTLIVNGRQEKIYGTITAVCAENLASHEVGGLKKGFGAGFRKCRWCLATPDDIQTKFCDSLFLPRTQEDHDEQVAGLENEELRQHISKLYGIENDSVLNELKNFHVTSNLPPDVMHDLLEGSIPLTINLLLKFCIDEKYFKLHQLNHIIKNFKYGRNEVKDKPAFIKTQHLFGEKPTLRGSATQKWLLAVCLPLMIGAFVPKRSKPWRCYILLLEICRLVFKNEISNYETIILGEKVEQFLTSFKSCFNRAITPKMHFLVHYPRLIRQFGPLLLFWCMRYEGKHAYFKSLQKRLGNWINVPFTLAYRHQQWMCAKQIENPEEFLKISIEEPSRASLAIINNSNYGGQIAHFFGLKDFLTPIWSLPWIKIGSSLLKTNESVVVCSLEGAVRAQFGLVVNILRFNQVYALVCKLFRTKRFDNHFQAYRVSTRRDNFHIVISPDHLFDYRVYCLHEPAFVKPEQMSIHKFVISKVDMNNVLLFS